ncbi:MAG TPA: metallophosphoesterase [Myxococcota bacterium]|nr:metallophosphoesterase [Myxococcota bacterium]HRY95416.1 metallophosphoesterase [Myxococcota bacterium]HSA21992.1 metallophosphoesterase [Myxococcota bacterium]
MSTGRVLVLADAHLRGRADPAQAELVRFLAAERGQLAGLVLLGDMFEYLAGPNRAALAEYAPFLEALEGLPGLHVFEGNHDFDLPATATGLRGARLHSGPAALELAGQRCWLLHGDRMSPFDLGTRLLRAALQSTPVRQLRDRWLPESALFRFALSFAAASRRGRWPGRTGEATWLRRRALRALRAGGLDTVLFAHTHVGLLEPWPEGLLANPGQARAGGSYLELEAGAARLRSFPAGRLLAAHTCRLQP